MVDMHSHCYMMYGISTAWAVYHPWVVSIVDLTNYLSPQKSKRPKKLYQSVGKEDNIMTSQASIHNS